MPTVPLYNQGATEEAGLTRAKRRVIKAMKSGIAKMTEKPDMDPTNGSADQLANLLIVQFEDLTALSRQVTVFLGDGKKYTEFDDPELTVKALKLTILASKVVARILRLSSALAKVMRFLDLGIMSDLKAVQEESNDAFFAAMRGLRIVDLSKYTDAELQMIANVQDDELGTALSEWDVEDDDLSTVGSITVGTKVNDNSTLGSKRSGSTSSKSGRSGSTKFKGSPPGSKLGRPTVKQSRVNTMFRYMFGAAEDLRNAGRTMSLDRPGKGKGTPRPRPRGRIPQVDQEEVDEDETQSVADAVNRGRRIAEMEEEEFQARARDDGSIPDLEPTALLQEQKKTDAQIELEIKLAEEQKETVPFTRFTVDAYKGVLDLLESRYKDAIKILYAAYRNFNAYRQQRDLPARAADADVGNAVKTGSGMYGDGFYDVQGTASRFYGVTPHIQKIYSVGGSSNILYEREGLPRFL